MAMVLAFHIVVLMVIIVKKNTTRAKLRELLRSKKHYSVKGFDAERFNGILKLKGDPVKVQRKLRDEW